jgi:hypothetical protein
MKLALKIACYILVVVTGLWILSIPGIILKASKDGEFYAIAFLCIAYACAVVFISIPIFQAIDKRFK